LTLPELQEKLDRLADGSLFQIPTQDYERLFGTNDAAAARLRNFARSHRCVASHSDGAVLFRKQLTRFDDKVVTVEPLQKASGSAEK
jgi:hypothetical protein